MSRPPLDVRCPCCEALVVVDPDTGAILRFERPKEKGTKVSLEDAFKSERSRRAEADARFTQAFGEMKNKEEVLEKRFQEALRKAKESPDEKPFHPFDKDLE